MSEKQISVLILDGYARQTLPMAKGFKKQGCTVTVLCFSKIDVGYISKYPDKRILFDCNKTDYDSQLAKVKEVLVTGDYDLVVPMTDYSAIYLSNNKEELSQYARIAVNDKNIFDLAINKVNTMQICEEYDIPSPKTLFSLEPLNDIDNSDLQYPLVMKPISACGSIGFNIADNRQHLETLLNKYDSSNGPIFIQEFVPQKGSQFNAEVFRDRDGKFKALLINEKVRWFPLNGGSSTLNITIEDKQLVEISKKLLDSMNWNGYANIDFVIDELTGEPKVIEVNARISAIVKINFLSGVDISKLILENEFEEIVSSFLTYKKDVRLGCCLTELLWFIKSPNRFNSNPSWFKRRKIKDVIFSWDDLKPFIGFCLQSIFSYKSAMKQRNQR